MTLAYALQKVLVIMAGWTGVGVIGKVLFGGKAAAEDMPPRYPKRVEPFPMK